MGRASNRKKARREEALRQAARRKRRATQQSSADARRRQAALALAAARKEIDRVFGPPREQLLPEYRPWCGEEPVPAEMPRWAEGSLGQRLCSGMDLSRARSAPCLLTATVPDPMTIITHPAQWRAASRLAELCKSDSPSILRRAA